MYLKEPIRKRNSINKGGTKPVVTEEVITERVRQISNRPFM